MNSRWITLLLAGAVWLPAAVALAQGEPPAAPGVGTTVAPVTVESTKPGELKVQAFNYVQAFGATSHNLDQLARWDIPICVSVQGLSPALAAKVKGRVEEVAQALGVAARPAGCAGNVQIFFTNKPQALMDKIAVEHEHFLGFWHHRDRDKLKAVTRPIQSWYVTATNGGGGNVGGITFANAGGGGTSAPPTPVPQGVIGHQPTGEAYDDEETVRMPTGCADSPFTSCLASVFRNVLVVVDISKAGDQPVDALADYVTLLAMAQPRSLEACNVLPSVIDMFAAACGGRDGKDGLSRADVAYLTALYKTNIESKKAGQQGDIANRMAEMLLATNAKDRVAAWGGGPKTAGK